MNPVDTFTIVNFAITIALGVLALALGGFAIWLSRHFDSKSSAALDAIKDLANEIRSLTNVSVVQQKEFSFKMLDSILSRDQYGHPTSESPESENATALEEAIKRQLSDTEVRIANAVEEKVRALSASSGDNPKELQNTLNEIRSQIKLMTKEAASTIAKPIDLSSRLRDALTKWLPYPAHYPILVAVVKEGSKSASDLERVAEKYNFAGGWKGGLKHLIDGEILSGSLESFDLTEKNRSKISAWVEWNWEVLQQLIPLYKQRSVKGVTQQERIVAAGLEF